MNKHFLLAVIRKYFECSRKKNSCFFMFVSQNANTLSVVAEVNNKSVSLVAYYLCSFFLSLNVSFFHSIFFFHTFFEYYFECFFPLVFFFFFFSNFILVLQSFNLSAFSLLSFFFLFTFFL